MVSKILSSIRVIRGTAAGFKFGVCEMQGYRSYMEDTHIVSELSPTSGLFGVFDGHGGDKVSQYLRDNATRLFLATKEYKEKQFSAAIRKTLLDADEELRLKKEIRNQCGSTATLMYIDSGKLYIGNVGDSRAIVCHNKLGIALTIDHKPTDPIERERIEAAGSFVCPYSGRINRLHYNLSRAVGDFYYKADDDLGPEAQVMSIIADVRERQLTPADSFILMCSDGVWDFRDTQEIVLTVRKALNETGDLGSACAELGKYVLNTPGDPNFKYLPEAAGKDNITCMLIQLLSTGTVNSS